MSNLIDSSKVIKVIRLNTKTVVVIVIAFVVMILAANIIVMPMYETRRNANGICDEIAKAEPYLTLKNLYPDDYDVARKAIYLALVEKKTRQEAYLRGRAELMSIVKNKMVYASDESLVDFVKAFVDIADYYCLNNKCLFAFGVLFDQKSLPLNWYSDLPSELTESEIKSYRNILISSVEKKEHIVDTKKTEKFIGYMASKMYSKYGEDFKQMLNPMAYPDNKEEIAKITLNFYGMISELPVNDRCMIIRQLFGKKDRQQYKVLNNRPTIINN